MTITSALWSSIFDGMADIHTSWDRLHSKGPKHFSSTNLTMKIILSAAMSAALFLFTPLVHAAVNAG